MWFLFSRCVAAAVFGLLAGIGRLLGDGVPVRIRRARKVGVALCRLGLLSSMPFISSRRLGPRERRE